MRHAKFLQGVVKSPVAKELLELYVQKAGNHKLSFSECKTIEWIVSQDGWLIEGGTVTRQIALSSDKFIESLRFSLNILESQYCVLTLSASGDAIKIPVGIDFYAMFPGEPWELRLVFASDGEVKQTLNIKNLAVAQEISEAFGKMRDENRRRQEDREAESKANRAALLAHEIEEKRKRDEALAREKAAFVAELQRTMPQSAQVALESDLYTIRIPQGKITINGGSVTIRLDGEEEEIIVGVEVETQTDGACGCCHCHHNVTTKQIVTMNGIELEGE